MCETPQAAGNLLVVANRPMANIWSWSPGCLCRDTAKTMTARVWTVTSDYPCVSVSWKKLPGKFYNFLQHPGSAEWSHFLPPFYALYEIRARKTIPSVIPFPSSQTAYCSLNINWQACTSLHFDWDFFFTYLYIIIYGWQVKTVERISIRAFHLMQIGKLRTSNEIYFPQY